MQRYFITRDVDLSLVGFPTMQLAQDQKLSGEDAPVEVICFNSNDEFLVAKKWAIRQRAISKLTTEECEAIGIDLAEAPPAIFASTGSADPA